MRGSGILGDVIRLSGTNLGTDPSRRARRPTAPAAVVVR
jgi:hypothetical protein